MSAIYAAIPAPEVSKDLSVSGSKTRARTVERKLLLVGPTRCNTPVRKVRGARSAGRRTAL